MPERTVSTRWGWLPALSLTSAVGLVVAAVAFTGARSDQPWSTALFWASLLLIFVPAAFRLSLSSITRDERIGLVVVVGLALYGVKVLHSPLHFTFHDEFLHWRTAQDILLSQHLFSDNTILTVSPLYPGLETVTTAFANLSGLSLFASATITLGMGRLVFMMALYLFYEQVGRAPQIGGLAALMYMANSNFLFFDAQFSYETLSLPIATAVLYLVMLRQRQPDRNPVRLLLIIVPLLGMVALTHHLTAYVLSGLLALWALFSIFTNRRQREWLDVGITAALSLVISVGWTLLTGNATENYLGPVFRGGATELIQLLFSDESGRMLFQGATGQVSPVWERIIGMAAVVCILVILPIGLTQVWRSPFSNRFRDTRVKVLSANAIQAWKRFRDNAPAFVLSLLVCAYPVMQGFRLTSSGWEIANRSSEFIFWATAFITVIGFLALQTSFLRKVWTPVFVVWATVVFIGGSIAGWPPWARMPGPYLVSADTRSIEPQGIAAAEWAGAHLDPQDRIASDRINSLLLATYGYLNPITHQHDGLYMSPIFTGLQLGPVERALMQQVELRYLLVDQRLSTALPRVGVYFEAGEPISNGYATPISVSALGKFDFIAGISRVFDSGDIQIYDAGALDAVP